MKYKAIRNKINASISLLKSVQKKQKASRAGGTKLQLKELNVELEKVVGVQKEMQKLKNELKARKKELGNLVKKLTRDIKVAKKAQKKGKSAKAAKAVKPEKVAKAVKPVKAAKVVKPVKVLKRVSPLKATRPVKPVKVEVSKEKPAKPAVKKTVKKTPVKRKVKSRTRSVIKKAEVVQPVVTLPPSEEKPQ